MSRRRHTREELDKIHASVREYIEQQASLPSEKRFRFGDHGPWHSTPGPYHHPFPGAPFAAWRSWLPYNGPFAAWAG